MNYNKFCKKYNIKLNEEQEQAVKKIKGPTLLISVPGSGKTTVIITRIAYMIFCENIKSDKILTVTFSVDAAKSMKNRYIEKFNVNSSSDIPEFSTIHSLSLKIVKYYCKKYEKIPFKIIENTSSIIKKITLENSDNKNIKENTIKEVINHISKSANLMYNNEMMSKIDIKHVNFFDIYQKYKKYKIDNSIMDFDDILIYSLNILKKYPDILEYFQNRFYYFNVDEAQDNSLVQNKIMNLLSSKYNNLFMVGDEDQCIYGFRGAYPKSFFEFNEKWGNENIIKLQTNYRSCDNILKQAKYFISQNKNRYEKDLIGIKNSSGKVNIIDCKNIIERDRHILYDSKNFETVAVLSRNNDSLITLCNIFLNNNIKFNIKAGKNDFFNSIVVKDFIRIFNSSLNNDFENLPFHLKKILANRNMTKYIQTLSPVQSINFIVKDMFYSKYLIAIARDGISYNNICIKLNILSTLAESTKDIYSFVKLLNKLSDICKTGCNDSNISLLTCHGSKGLEFDKVYIIDVLDNIFPCCDFYDVSENSSMEYEEEVRLFYVAITRAKNEVEILNVKHTEWAYYSPSIFVKQIQKEIENECQIE